MTSLGLVGGLFWLFARGGIGTFVGTRNATYKVFTLEFIRTIKVEIIQGLDCIQDRIAFRLGRKPFVLTLNAFNVIFGFLQDMGFSPCHTLRILNPVMVWQEFMGLSLLSHSSKGINIRNPYLCFAQRSIASGLFSIHQSTNVPRHSELYFLW